MKITNKAENRGYEFGSLKSGELFIDLVNFKEDDVFVKLDHEGDIDSILDRDIDGAAINLKTGYIYTYRNDELVVKIETELLVLKYL